MTAQARVAASWMQGKVDIVEAERKVQREATAKTRETRWIECPDCRTSGPHGGLGLCRRCYRRYRKALLVGRCGVCNHPEDRKLHSLTPPVCHACYARQNRKRLREEQPEIYRERNARYARHYRARHPEAQERSREYHAGYYADPEKRRKKIDQDRQRRTPRAEMTEEERRLAQEVDRIRYAARKKREDAAKNKPPVLVPEPRLTVHLVQDTERENVPIMPEGSFAEALAFRQKAPTPRRTYRRRHAA